MADPLTKSTGHEEYGWSVERRPCLAAALQGHHPDILVVRNGNNRKKDLDDAGIVRAIAKLKAAGVPVADQYIILNQWH